MNISAWQWRSLSTEFPWKLKPLWFRSRSLNLETIFLTAEGAESAESGENPRRKRRTG